MSDKAEFILKLVTKWLRKVRETDDPYLRRCRLRAAREFMRDYQQEIETQ